MARRASALDRASAALNRKGSAGRKKPALDSETSDDAAELNKFLSALSQKPTAGKSAGLSDISISSDDDLMARPKPNAAGGTTTSATNKFLKSTKPSAASAASYSKSLPTKSVTSSITNQSPALQRLSQQTQRFMRKNSSMAAGAKSLHVSEDSTIVSETSESIGATGHKFLKSKQAGGDNSSQMGQSSKRLVKTPLPAHSLRTSTEDDSDMAAYMQRLSPTASEVSDDDNVKAKMKPASSFPQAQPSARPAAAKEDSSFATETFSTHSVQRESLDAESSEINTDSAGGPLPVTVLDIGALTPAFSKPSSAAKKETSTSNMRRQKDMTSKAFNSLGLMSVDDLLPTQTSSTLAADRSISIVTESSIKSQKSDQYSYDSGDYSESSIHTYKESVKTDSIDSKVRTHLSAREDEYISDFDDTLRETDSIATQPEYSRSSESRGSRTSSFDSHTKSNPRSSSRSPHRTYSPASYSSWSESYSLSQTYSRSRSPSRSRSISRSRSPSTSRSASCSRSPGGLRSIDKSRSPSGSRSIDRSRSASKSRSPSRSRSEEISSCVYSASFEEPSDVEEKRVPAARADACVQTGLQLDEMILKYYWMSDQAIPSVSSAPAEQVFPLPPKLASLAVSNEALEALTSYNPAVLALSDMMKQQLALSRQFLSIQKDMHKNVMESIEREYTYTSLEETNQYIQRRRRPRLTFDEALAMVKDEMNI